MDPAAELPGALVGEDLMRDHAGEAHVEERAAGDVRKAPSRRSQGKLPTQSPRQIVLWRFWSA
jgi:hypothetical protein